MVLIKRVFVVLFIHSFTGTAHHVRELLELEKQIKRLCSTSSSIREEPLFYFGFSHAVNCVMSSSSSSEKSQRKGKEAVQAVPWNRLMVESDVHHSRDVLGGTLAAISYVAWAREESIVHVAEVTTRNGMAFLSSVIGKGMSSESDEMEFTKK